MWRISGSRAWAISAVYWYQLRAQGTTFLAFGVASGLLIWILFRLVTPSGGIASGSLIRFGNEQIIGAVVRIRFKKFALPVAAVLGLLFGLAFSGDWNTYALFLNRPAAARHSRSDLRPAIVVLLLYASRDGSSGGMVSDDQYHRRRRGSRYCCHRLRPENSRVSRLRWAYCCLRLPLKPMSTGIL